MIVYQNLGVLVHVPEISRRYFVNRFNSVISVCAAIALATWPTVVKFLPNVEVPPIGQYVGASTGRKRQKQDR